MPDLSQYLPLLPTTDDATIAGMAGCSVDEVAAFRAANTSAPAVTTAAAPARAAKRAAPAPTEASPSAPPPPPKSVASYVADLSQADAEALYDALHTRLHPKPEERPTPHAVKLLRTARLTGVSGQPANYSLGDVYSGELAAHLWTRHRDAVRAYPS